MKKIIYLFYAKSIGVYINFLSFVFPEKATQIAYNLFSEPRKGRLIKTSLPTVLQNSDNETFQHNGHHFQSYTWKGNNTVILLVHGWESNASRWEKILPYLQESGSTIIAIDAPAHGLSSGKEFNIPQYAEFIHVLFQKFQPTHLIGHSLGAKTCLYYQSVYQNSDLQKIVVLGSPSDFNIILNNYIALLSLNSIVSKGLSDHYLKSFDLKLEHFSGKLFVSKIKTKGFIAHDTDDTVVLFAEAKKIASTWKNSILIETNGLGHSLHDDDLYKKIACFLFETE
ncbi:alpha/beta fold hydrolase [Flavobacterium sp. W22_SRS_FP1]|uniref:alpha/beta fold hydrolase n=1 Tax=Flavobacterium sp. W22_SRS_FP1 TaxID=3240276 RepID=UPI003F92D247